MVLWLSVPVQSIAWKGSSLKIPSISVSSETNSTHSLTHSIVASLMCRKSVTLVMCLIAILCNKYCELKKIVSGRVYRTSSFVIVMQVASIISFTALCVPYRS